MNNSDISTNELIVRYMNFVENNIPLVNEYIDYISNTERHMFDILNYRIQNDIIHEEYINNNNNNNNNINNNNNNINNDNNHNHNHNNVNNNNNINRANRINRVNRVNNTARHSRPDINLHTRDQPYNIRRHNINNNRARNQFVDTSGNNVIGNLMNIFENLNNDVFNNNVPVNQMNYFNGLHNVSDIPQNLNPVIVRPSDSQIANATEISLFSEIENPLNANCPILVEPFLPTSRVSRIRHCGHCFDSNALEHWFSLNVRCPVCRYDIRTYSPTYTPSLRQEPVSMGQPGQRVTDPSFNILYTFQYYTPTDPPTDSPTDSPTDRSTDPPTDPSTDRSTDPPTDRSTDPPVS